ncbi:MAG: TolC family protein [Bacteroidota bacterium]|nr:TolC family protein [Bacteroidota bacterium]
MRKSLIFFHLFLLLPGFFLQAQQQPWTFQQCLDTAIRRNITLNQTRLANETNKITLSQSKAARMPNLSANTSEGLNFGKNISNTTNQYVVETYSSTNFGLSASLNLFNGLQATRTIQKNNLAVQAGDYDIKQSENDVILNITTAYLQVLLQYEVLDAANNQASADSSQVERTRKLVDAGKVPELNLYQMQAQYATDKLSVVNALSQLDLAKVTLQQLMEIPVMDTFEITKPQFPDPENLISGTSDQIYQKALSIRPEIASASIRTNSALLGVKINEGARWPRLSLGGSASTNYAASSNSSRNTNHDPFFQQTWDNLGEGLSLGLSIPIYSNRQIKSSIEKAKITELDARLSEQNTKNQLRKVIEQSFTDQKNAFRKYDATKQQYTSAEVSYKSIEKKYNVGMVSAIDYLVEKNNYYQSLSNLIQAKFDYIFKSKILDFYQGKAIQL